AASVHEEAGGGGARPPGPASFRRCHRAGGMMITLLAKRLLSAIPLLLFLSFFVYLLVDLMPGDAAANLAGDNASAADIAALREQLGLDRPLVVRYIECLGDIVTGDFGTSLYSSQSVTQILTERMPITLSLALVTMVIVICVGLPLG